MAGVLPLGSSMILQTRPRRMPCRGGKRGVLAGSLLLALTLYVQPAEAARVYSSGFELNSLTNGHECQTVVATGLSISTTTVRSGNYGLRVNGMTSGTEASCNFRIALIDNPAGNLYIRTYFRFVTFPAAQNRIIEVGGAAV